jgi:hypothetical protein
VAAQLAASQEGLSSVSKLFKDTVCILGYKASNGWTLVNNEFERMWMEVVTAQMMVFSRNLPGGLSKITKYPSEQFVSQPRCEPKHTSQVLLFGPTSH